MSKIYACQRPPEWQESHLCDDYPHMFDGLPGFAIQGNNELRSLTFDRFDAVSDTLDDIPCELRNMLDDIPYARECGAGKNKTEILMNYLPPENGVKYNPRQVHELCDLIFGYDRAAYTDVRGLRELFCAIFSIVAGGTWRWRTIRGYLQGDWNILYYDADRVTTADIHTIETEYFNTGTEWMVHDSDDEPTSPDDIYGYSIYCHSCDSNDIKQEIKDAHGDKDAEVILYDFNGWKRSAEYKRID